MPKIGRRIPLQVPIPALAGRNLDEEVGSVALTDSPPNESAAFNLSRGKRELVVHCIIPAARNPEIVQSLMADA
jgi:hypothetical protein